MSASTAALKRSAPAAEQPFRAVGRLIKQVFSSLVRGVDERMQPLELTAMQWEPLLLLYLERADTVAALARESQVNCGAMTRMLDRLEHKNLVRRRRSEADRRVVHLELTGKGEDAGKAIQPLINAELKRHLRGFSEHEIATLKGFLSRMVENGK
ncbi:MAG TPA: MarR family transcriptional regulator [Gammaproteobacteria bacterium]|nr:MarR family transcriptional regulator [Gammaproteobacteria bacterium]